MDASIKSGTGFSLSLFSAMVVTALIFISMPMLTEIKLTSSPETENEPILLEKWKPPPPPSDTRDDQDPQPQTPPEARADIERDRPRWEQPKIDISSENLWAATNGAIEISIPSTSHDTSFITNPTYKPGEVDQQPKMLRSFPPHYPYRAKRDNIEGWVVLRFVVDTEGIAEKMEVVSADPVGIFEEEALKAVARYRFKPAVKNGENVKCITMQRISFKLD